MAVSDTSMVSATRIRMPPTLPPARPALSACATSRLRRPSRRDTSRLSSVARVMMPEPPICDSTVSSTCPKPDQYVGVSTIDRSVTQTADAAVNSAVTNGACPGWARVAGSIISAVPIAMAPRKANGRIRAGYCHTDRPRTSWSYHFAMTFSGSAG
jgi:hypothetical protein